MAGWSDSIDGWSHLPVSVLALRTGNRHSELFLIFFPLPLFLPSADERVAETVAVGTLFPAEGMRPFSDGWEYALRRCGHSRTGFSHYHGVVPWPPRSNGLDL